MAAARETWGDWEGSVVRFDWSTRPAKAYRVLFDRELEIGSGSRAAEIWYNSSPLSPEKAVRMLLETEYLRRFLPLRAGKGDDGIMPDLPLPVLHLPARPLFHR